ncbi:lysophospholipase III [Schistosoma bovis]|uniref:non-specific serine/threonine protein kinase n=1 Tax=Schistosoma bovis TaxID=6184 RepID=A0A430QSL3_SCHBO|nr:lysophospholipase III [Schistosoma bovis]
MQSRLNGNIKVGDFGISRSLATTEELATTFIGTPYYMSPEVLKYEGYNNKSDICNIFLKNGNIKVGDFGISRSLATTEELATTFIGTPYYMSPEVLKYEGYNNKSDIWSIGIILYELCTQRRAFTGTNLMRVMWQVINDPCPQLPEIYSKELQEVLELMLKKTPQERPSASELLQSNAVHSYLRSIENAEKFSIQLNEEIEENVEHSEDQYLTPRQKIKLNKATESDRTTAVLRDLAEQLTHTRNSLNSTMETQLFTWQKGYPSLNHIWPTIQIPTEKLLNELKNLYLEKINNETSLIDELDDDLENEDNKKLPGKGPGAEDESLGTFNFLNSTKHRNEEIEDLTNNMSFTEIKNFYPSPRLTSPIYDYVTMDEFKKQVDIDNNPNIIKKGNNNQEALFIRRQFTFPAMLNQNYAQSARQLSDINSSKLKCNSVFTDDTQLMETYYTNYDNELLNYTNNFNKEDLKELIENENVLQNDLEDIENQDNVDSTETLNDVLVCMKAALCHPEDSNTIVLNDEAKTIFSPEAKAKRIDALKKYCIDKLGEKEFHNAYHYLYQKRILEKNQSGELTILNGLKSYCSDVTTGFLLDHLLFLENDAVKQTINIQLSESVHQILNDDLSFYALITWEVNSESTSDGQYPLVMIPGTAGCQAFAVLKNDPNHKALPVWLNLEFFAFIKHFTEYFKLQYDPKTGHSYDAEGVDIIFPGWGETWSIENLDERPNMFSEYFGSLVNALRKDPFYVSNFTMRGAPYDFRKAPNENGEFFNKLKALIEETYENAKQRPVVLLPHSMGCLFAQWFLKKCDIPWKKKYIKSLVFSSCPFGGSVKTVKIEASGDNFGVFLRSPLSFRHVQRSMPSLPFLFPDSRLWPSSEPLIITPTTNYSSADYERFFKDINYTIGYQMWKDTHSLVDGLEMPTGIDDIYCIHGSRLSTTEKISYSAPSYFYSGFPDQVPLLIPGDGDGTVGIRSLEYCKNWPGIKYYILPGAEHVRILSDVRHINIILKILNANITHE